MEDYWARSGGLLAEWPLSTSGGVFPLERRDDTAGAGRAAGRMISANLANLEDCRGNLMP